MPTIGAGSDDVTSDVDAPSLPAAAVMAIDIETACEEAVAGKDDEPTSDQARASPKAPAGPAAAAPAPTAARRAAARSAFCSRLRLKPEVAVAGAAAADPAAEGAAAAPAAGAAAAGEGATTSAFRFRANSAKRLSVAEAAANDAAELAAAAVAGATPVEVAACTAVKKACACCSACGRGSIARTASATRRLTSTNARWSSHDAVAAAPAPGAALVAAPSRLDDRSGHSLNTWPTSARDSKCRSVCDRRATAARCIVA